ncbi:FMN-dependent NADH-azoreductase [Reinekea marinisedimentorum]|uniref:FMN dependent NADH:quinone oxidoreductase n=1 Tax=Reinekea marinisedimentorum TaxID=230495 RepID=A0A4R3I4H0_9GAMM|nr:NAD(P)H-dependent oxidoreductase [Reinekea marinisedimentorum]TCS39791.1 FMN-dependent NADH-azoreductase [Reinekea marinisedimentorum]
MKNILALYTSISGDNSLSTQLAKEWLAKQDAKVIERDLATNPVPHLTMETFSGFMTPEEGRSESQQAQAALSDTLIKELKEADTLLISIPMYNFGIPSTLKSWIDYISRAGMTFQYSANGPEGLVKNTRAVVVLTRGGLYQGTEADVQAPFIKLVLGFIGITDVEFIYAEGVAMGEEAKQVAISSAKEKLTAVTA